MIAESTVVLARSMRPEYTALSEPVSAPELPGGRARTIAQAALRDLFLTWGLDSKHAGTPEWNPLGELVQPGARVVLKPNWVLHFNQADAGMDCLVTHPSLIEAVLDYLVPARPSDVVLGDAPLQACDFQRLIEHCGIDDIVRRGIKRGLPLRVADFRRTVMRGRGFGANRDEDCRDLDRYVLFDLARQSLLEPLAAGAALFRVTMYDPDLLGRTHAAGKHQYLIAREVIEADLVLNLPKLKTHKKSCITGALKNLVGINGNKEYLPHHRKGGAGRGGDCYAGGSWLKGRAEDLLDQANRAHSAGPRRLLGTAADLVFRCAVALGEDRNIEGSWYGNDTVWRTCLDLQRILRYGRLDGSLAERPQRTVLSITDAIIGGEGEGPLVVTPALSGFVTGSLSTAAAEWVHARLMGFDPDRVPLVREAFGQFPHPLVAFPPSEIRVRTGKRELPAAELEPAGAAFRPAEGWRGHCELSEAR